MATKDYPLNTTNYAIYDWTHKEYRPTGKGTNYLRKQHTANDERLRVFKDKLLKGQAKWNGRA